MSRVVHRLQSVLDYAASKHSEWAAAAQTLRKEKEDAAASKNAAEQAIVDGILAYANAHPELWKPRDIATYDTTGELHIKIPFEDVDGSRKTLSAWTAARHLPPSNKMLDRLELTLPGNVWVEWTSDTGCTLAMKPGEKT